MPQLIAFPQDQLSPVWSEVYSKLQRRARQLCQGDSYQADELLSDTSLKVYLYLQHSPGRIHNLAGFLFFVLMQTFLDYKRKQARERKVFDLDCNCDEEFICQQVIADRSPEQELDQKQQLIHVSAVLDRLDPAQKDLFRLKFEQDLSYPQIAACLGINEPLARKRVSLLRKKVQQQLSH